MSTSPAARRPRGCGFARSVFIDRAQRISPFFSSVRSPPSSLVSTSRTCRRCPSSGCSPRSRRVDSSDTGPLPLSFRQPLFSRRADASSPGSHELDRSRAYPRTIWILLNLRTGHRGFLCPSDRSYRRVFFLSFCLRVDIHVVSV